jgi:hypothetical protein
LSISGVEGIYRTAYADCRLEDNPPAAAMQQPVAVMEGSAENPEEVAWRFCCSARERILRHDARKSTQAANHGSDDLRFGKHEGASRLKSEM